jgi:hypothetical protein
MGAKEKVKPFFHIIIQKYNILIFLNSQKCVEYEEQTRGPVGFKKKVIKITQTLGHSFDFCLISPSKLVNYNWLDH